jgi:hypothetical protein
VSSTDATPAARAGGLRRLLVSVACAIAIAAAVELCLYVTFHPTFWQRTTWLMYDPYRGESFDRLELYLRLSHLENSDPDIISVGDSSGFFSLQSTVINRFTGGAKFLSLSTGANQAYDGYQGIAEYMLRRSKHTKYVVLYLYPQLLPQQALLDVADLGPITHNDLVGPRSYLTPPSAFLSPYAKFGLLRRQRYSRGELINSQLPTFQLQSTVDDALGWLPEFDVRYDRVDGRLAFFSDERSGWYNNMGLTDPSSINAHLDAFDKVVHSYGAQLIVAFAPIGRRIIREGDPNVAVADQALERFQHSHPDVKFLFPLLTEWGNEKFGQYNHVSREYTFLSSERLGRALGRLVRDPDSIPPYKAQAKVLPAYPPIVATPTGPDDPSLLAPALALYLYTSTNDAKYRALLSSRVEALLANEAAFVDAMTDARDRVASLTLRNINIGFDLSQLRARPVAIDGLPHCGEAPGRAVQWVQLYGTMIFTYDSPTLRMREPTNWPETSHIYIPTVVEDGVRKFDGYCPEPSMSEAAAAAQ